MKRTLLLIAASCYIIPSICSAVIYTVPATANIFSAGLASPVAPAGGGAGTLPVMVTLSSGALQFSASGIVNYDGTVDVGPDGYPLDAGENVNAYGGVSGYKGQTGALLGVFLSNATPAAPAPSTIDFTTAGVGTSFLNLSPQIGQVFFIGDGQTAGHLAQTFFVPSGATRLFLGIADCSGGSGDPGFYDDNVGSYSVNVVVPEPGSAALLGIGASLLFAFRFTGTTSTSYGHDSCDRRPRWHALRCLIGP
jgi:hypothetical protein